MKTLSRLLLVLPALLCGFTAQAQSSPSAAPSTPDTTAPVTAAAAQPAATSAPTIDPAKAEEIRKYVQLMGTARQMDVLKMRMLAMFKQQRPDVSDAMWNKVEGEMNTDELLEKLLPLYDKYYTLDDLKAANAFYESPAGQRMTAATPQIMQESMSIGQQWGREMSQKIQAELQEDLLEQRAKQVEEKAAASAAAATNTPASTPITAPATAPASATATPQPAPTPAPAAAPSSSTPAMQ